MNVVTIYWVDSGAIVGVVELPDLEWADRQIESGQAWIEGAYSDDTYFVDPSTRTAYLMGDYTLDTLPLPCVVEIDGLRYECAEQPQIAFAEPGMYTVSVDAGPRYLKKDFEVEWNADSP